MGTTECRGGPERSVGKQGRAQLSTMTERILLGVLLVMFVAVTPSSARPYYELEGQSGAYAGKAPKGAVLVIHGGA